MCLWFFMVLKKAVLCTGVFDATAALKQGRPAHWSEIGRGAGRGRTWGGEEKRTPSRKQFKC